MSPIEDRYRNFCERLANELEAEAKFYEEHPSLHDREHQLIGFLRDQSREWRQKLEQIEAASSA